MSRITLTDLDAVMAIARRGTFRAAAIELGVSTTALSHIIARFEAEMGVRLFNRTTRSVGLTDAGRLFIDNIGPSLQGVHQALEVVRSRSETPSGVLRINTPPFAARTLLSRVVLEFLRRYPQMQVDIVTDGRLIDIVAEGFDMGVRVASLIPEDMIALSLGKPQRYAWWLLRSIFRTISGLKPPQICSIIPASGCVCPMVPSIAGILRSKEKRYRSMSAGS